MATIVMVTFAPSTRTSALSAEKRIMGVALSTCLCNLRLQQQILCLWLPKMRLINYRLVDRTEIAEATYRCCVCTVWCHKKDNGNCNGVDYDSGEDDDDDDDDDDGDNGDDDNENDTDDDDDADADDYDGRSIDLRPSSLEPRATNLETRPLSLALRASSLEPRASTLEHRPSNL